MKPLQRRDDVKSSDVISIPASSRIEILDTDSRRIYSSTRSGEMSVDRLIADAKKDASSLTRKTNGKILSAVTDNAGQKVSGYGATGLSHHEADGVLNGLIVLPDSVSLLCYLMNLPPDLEYDDRADVILMRRDYEDGDDTFNFSVFNTLSSPLYVNVIDQKPSDGRIRLYFDESPIAGARCETLISQYRFMLPEEEAGYIVIASPQPFTMADVKRLLDVSFSPSRDFYISLLRI